MRVVDAFRDDEARTQPGGIAHDGEFVQGLHADLGGVGEHVGGINGGAEGGRVVEVVNGNDAVSLFIDALGKGMSAFPEFVLAVEELDFLEAFDSGAGADGRGSAAGADENHGLALRVKARFLDAVEVARTVGVVADQTAVLVDDRVDGAGEFSGRIEFVNVFDGELLVGMETPVPRIFRARRPLMASGKLALSTSKAM